LHEKIIKQKNGLKMQNVLHVKEKLVACFVSFQLMDAGKL